MRNTCHTIIATLRAVSSSFSGGGPLKFLSYPEANVYSSMTTISPVHPPGVRLIKDDDLKRPPRPPAPAARICAQGMESFGRATHVAGFLAWYMIIRTVPSNFLAISGGFVATAVHNSLLIVVFCFNFRQQGRKTQPGAPSRQTAVNGCRSSFQW